MVTSRIRDLKYVKEKLVCWLVETSNYVGSSVKLQTKKTSIKRFVN
ncbi:hypothetical protein KAW65_01240 [candidate division WOR-3 bacterium]|nr:hypothetical protein [candidate division WOR-3 bacterium]